MVPDENWQGNLNLILEEFIKMIQTTSKKKLLTRKINSSDSHAALSNFGNGVDLISAFFTRYYA